MTRAQKLALHLEMVIWEDLPEGTALDTSAINRLVGGATDDQRRRAYERALTKAPLLLAEELPKKAKGR